jgi:SAM-dependent methyltransferase
MPRDASRGGLVVSVRDEPLLSGFRTVSVEDRLWEELPDCPVCRSAEHLQDVGIVEAEARGGVTSACLACEHVFMRRRPTRTWFDDFYREQWDEAGRAGHQRKPLTSTKVADFCAPFLPEGGRVLEVGAGFGQELLGFRERGYDVAGLEPSEHRARYVSEVLGIPCASTPLEGSTGLRGLQLVYTHHVLEHVHDPAAAVAICAEMLAVDGMLYIAVPNLWHEHAPQSFHFVPHLSIFSVRSLTRLLARSGLSVLKSDVGQEIQVLASPNAENAPAEAPGASDSQDFANQVTAWAAGAFGDRGRHALVWFKPTSGDVLYERRIASGAQVRVLRAAQAVRTALPPPLMRALSPVLPDPVRKGSLRILPVEVEGEPALPVLVRHQGHDAPVWVK